MPASERDLIVAFLLATDRSVAGRTVPLTVCDEQGRDAGTRAWAVLDDARPRVEDANLVNVEHAGGADAGVLVRAAEEALRPRGGAHGGIVLAQAAEGEARARGFAELGWRAAPALLMVHRDASRLAPAGAARRMSEHQTRAARRELTLSENPGAEELADQVLSRTALVVRRNGGSWYGVERDGEVVSTCMLLHRDGIAQVEDVGTIPAARGQGLARAMVSLATARAREQAGLVFLCADPLDWPRLLYERLGYEPIGVLHRFCPVFPGLGDAQV